LPAGPLSIFENAGFAGETLIERLVPGDRAFLAYGEDLDVASSDEARQISRTTERVVWNASRTMLEEHYVDVTEHRLSLKNHGGTPRTVAWSLAEVVRNAKVEGADEMDFDDGSEESLALFAVPERKAIERTLRITEGKAQHLSLDDMSKETVLRLSNEPKLAASVRTAFKAATPHIDALRAASERRDAVELRISELQQGLERNREHLKAAEGSAGGANPIATRIVELEKALDASRTELARAEKALPEFRKQATAALEDLESAKPVARAHERRKR
jgi:cob(I)alamin adenosyltransferase